MPTVTASQLVQTLAMEDGTTAPRIQVNEMCLDVLLSEVVEYAFQRSLVTGQDREAVAAKLEGLGYRVGVALAERQSFMLMKQIYTGQKSPK